ncbi:MAG: pentapeptide repeat-containing protein [Microcoleus vaginatus WJT46-NPBG5]|jgi:uncharacterized protein YjbI with pentapeptide repeats|nr:pentapeptide repeat-containing protein [Microcoleus vaginatus WJT46-NPBG5]
MGEHPDFFSHGYQVIRELGRNREAGRITYLATALNHNQQVVIKEFRFAMAGSDWSGYKAYEREIEVLQQLDHPRIPQYLNSFETSAGFCLVQEYKNAPSLAEKHSFTPEEVKQIAESVLEILVYLQTRSPSVIHRDIKPENILVDKQLNAYLIDFGLAKIRGGELAISSVAAGTPGFMPPEEQFGRSLTEASDLYSLGATLICLLTGTRSVDIGNLMDDNYRFNFKGKTSKINPRFTDWLAKMVAPNLKQRYANAGAALEALKPVKGTATALEILLGRAIIPRDLTNIVIGLAAITLFSSSAIIKSLISSMPNPLVRQLQETKECRGCDLKDTYLWDANLEGAKLEGADLRSAQLWRANLTGANLTSANLESVRLWSANLESANLTSANLKDANLNVANLTGANLTRANLNVANLESANLTSANLTGANLESARLAGSNLNVANLTVADLTGANLTGANLESARLAGSKLERATLTTADLEGADLTTANLTTADLTYANLTVTNLAGANLAGANLKGANLKGANLKGANLKDANLKDANLAGAIMPDGTKHK